MTAKGTMTVKSVVNTLLDLLFYVLIGVLLAMLCIELGNIIGRPFGFPIQGSVELTGYLGAVLISLAVFYATLRHANVVVGLFASKLKGKIRDLLEAFVALVGIGTNLLLAWAAGTFARKMSLEGEQSLMLNINIPAIRYIFMAGLILVAVALFVDFCKAMAKVVKQ